MRRDLDLVLAILQDAQAIPPGCPASGFEYPDQFSQPLVNEHVRALLEEGFLRGEDISGVGQDEPIFFIRGLTWKGHDLVDHARQAPSIWAAAKAQALSQAVSMPLDLLLEWLKSRLA